MICAIDVLPNKYTPIATAIAGAIAIKGSPNAPFNFVSNTTEPVANAITKNVPKSSAKKIFYSCLIYLSEITIIPETSSFTLSHL